MNKTKEDLLVSITTVVHKEIPEILELKFGCEYRDNKGDTLIFVRSSGNHHYGILKRSMSNTLYSCVKSDAEILGRQITLPDILIAIGKKNNKKYQFGEDQMWCIAENGMFFHLRHIDTKGERTEWPYVKEKRVLWDLTKSLQDQSLETLQFIANLLV